jgi:two-component system LytT family sensor kinase
MSIQELILSDKPHLIWRRHLLFWTIFAFGFFVQSILPVPNPILGAFKSLLCFLPACLIAGHFTNFLLVPRYFEKRRYGFFLVGFFTLSIICLAINCCASYIFVGIADRVPAVSRIFALAIINTGHAVMIGVITGGFRMARKWYIMQRENQNLMRQKMLYERQVEKSSLYPGFLLKSLHDLQNKMIIGSPDSPKMLLALSDLLSHILYETSEPRISVTRELTMLRNLVEIEKLKFGDRAQIRLQVQGNVGGWMIKPLMVFPVLQKWFESIEDCGQPHLRMNLTVNVAQSILQITMRANIELDHLSARNTTSLGQSLEPTIAKLIPESAIATVVIGDGNTSLRMEVPIESVNTTSVEYEFA